MAVNTPSVTMEDFSHTLSTSNQKQEQENNITSRSFITSDIVKFEMKENLKMICDLRKTCRWHALNNFKELIEDKLTSIHVIWRQWISTLHPFIHINCWQKKKKISEFINARILNSTSIATQLIWKKFIHQNQSSSRLSWLNIPRHCRHSILWSILNWLLTKWVVTTNYF